MITIEFSSTHIRLVETAGRRIVKWASRSLDPSMFEGEIVSNPQALGTIIREFMKTNGMEGKNVIAGVSGLYSLSRTVMVRNPPMGTALREVVLDAAKEVMPLDKEELYLSWQPLATIEGEQQMLVVGVPRDMIDNEMHALRIAGVNPRILELKSMALMRAVNRGQALILNIDPTTFDTVMVVDGVVEVMRTTAWQPEGLSLDEKAEQLSIALDLVVAFYNSHHPGSPLKPSTPLFITGQMSVDNALVEKLKPRMGYSIEPLKPPLEIPTHMPISQYAVNIGLALRGTVPSENTNNDSFLPVNINLLPQIYMPWKPSARQIYFACAIVVALVLLFPLFSATRDAVGNTNILKARYDVFNEELQRRQVELAKREPLQKAIDEYNSILDMGGGVTEDLNIINSKAEELDIVLNSVVHQGNSITINCQADDYTIFREYITALEESGLFSTPIPPPEGYPYIKGGIIKVEPATSQ